MLSEKKVFLSVFRYGVLACMGVLCSCSKVSKPQEQFIANTDSASIITKPQKPQKKPASVTVDSQPQRETRGTLSLGYASYNGEIIGGKPHGIGRMTFKSSHQIDSRDTKARMAEAGDVVEGEFYEGHLVQGIWYGADGEAKGSVLIGR